MALAKCRGRELSVEKSQEATERNIWLKVSYMFILKFFLNFWIKKCIKQKLNRYVNTTYSPENNFIIKK